MNILKKPFRKLKLGHSSSGDSVPKKVDTDSAASSVNGVGTPTNGHSNGNGNALAGSDVDSRRQSREIINAERERRSLDKQRVKAEAKKRETMARIEDEKFLEEGPADMTKLYKPFSMNMSKDRTNEPRILFKDLDFEKMDGELISFRARIHTLRRLSAKLVFIVFRQQTMTIQGVLQSFNPIEELQKENKGTITEQMVRSVEHYPSETIVVVHAKLRKAVKKVKNATIHDYELDVIEVHKVGDLTEHVPFTVYDAENINRDRDDIEDDEDAESSLYPSASDTPKGADTPRDSTPKFSTPRSSTDMIRASTDIIRRSTIGRGSVDKSRTSMDVFGARSQRSLPQRVRLNNRIVDLRTGPSQAIFRIQSGICNLFRTYLDDQGFIEIHTPKLQGGATESGASVFELNYFGRPAFLAQSPQLAKQMAIASDFERVYEVGPVFRAEDSNTPRHLTEYTGLDLEMALEEHYHEALDIIDGMFKNLWKGIYTRYQKEIDLISEFYPQERVMWLEETPRIKFADGVKLLIEEGWVDEEGNPPKDTEDLATRAEIRLGAIVREKYNTDYYILDKFPASARPFYTMPDPSDNRYTNSFDIFMRGQEILSGGQRIHDAKFLEKNLKAKGIHPDTMTEYLEGFRWGAPPHAGCGIGLERLTYLFLNLGNIRLASMFPRDPKSLPAQPPRLALRHEEASTTNPPWEQKDYEELSEDSADANGVVESRHEYQPLEKLIANYGDAANTSWLDTRYKVWRHQSTGAAQGYVVHNNYAIAVGEPLCAKSQVPQMVSGFLQFLKEEHKELKPLWMIAGPQIEEYLGEKFLWRTLGCIAEERTDPRNNPASKDKDLARKIRHAEAEGMKEIDLPFGEPVPEDLMQKIDARVEDWKKGRKGTQVHLTEIRPWVDQQHRRYSYSQGPDGTIHAICVLHQLSAQNGYQVKFSLEFPNAPSGTIESLILHSLRSVAAADPECKQVTFGTGAMPTLEGGRNMGKTKTKALRKAYEGINKQFKLTNKSEFREKMGVRNEPVYVCYPRGGLGAGGIRAIMGFLEDEG
ncbi:related to aspartate-tRNA ligase, cytosolic [Rhynchosporium graminicola]|uniref:aspartate--tRNA ligase n=1 Tax=Rhynchosporium graminicola TaxID=2792576 RepID=A0A1E1LBL5_9HELO|nr:related to aspartate-tRNA ligase, cytosolic [Rhynchosporium commune]